ncbi:hypothetical protein NO2_0700 [Candidatus Termititenax persephonae]|uniref:Uncharacterized protein n=1 Tax=Candidatus Termititenax persephonae TaxID=2218525 RepID=A0A388TG86_9BACT|nr:hypothetical protein NO2_0700 [Candidatus Termititenax persephonae]
MVRRIKEQHTANQIIADTVIEKFDGRLAAIEKQLLQPKPEDMYFMQMLKSDAPCTHTKLCKCLEIGLVNFDQVDKKFDFYMDIINCAKFFKETGYTTYKQIARFIKIDGKKTKPALLKDYAKDKKPATKEWLKIKSKISLN